MNEKAFVLDSMKGLVYPDGSAVPAEALESLIQLAQCQLKIAQGLAELASWSRAFQRLDVRPEYRWPKAGDVTWIEEPRHGR